MVTWDPVEQEGEGDHMEEVGVGSVQLEEAYARATVALTRARRLCVLLCPLDQKGPIGAATILGCLQYGLGYLQHSHLEMPSREC